MFTVELSYFPDCDPTDGDAVQRELDQLIDFTTNEGDVIKGEVISCPSTITASRGALPIVMITTDRLAIMTEFVIDFFGGDDEIALESIKLIEIVEG